MKYNKSEIMTNAWSLYRMNAKVVPEYRKSFSQCLTQAWAAAKRIVRLNEMISHSVLKVINGGKVEMRHGMTASGYEGWMVFGKTYGCKTELRRMGFVWDCEGRYWETNDRAVARKFADA